MSRFGKQLWAVFVIVPAGAAVQRANCVVQKTYPWLQTGLASADGRYLVAIAMRGFGPATRLSYLPRTHGPAK